ncbi:MAG TPA: prolyl oligopeptidase family serine peptidase [Rhizomicrobium sp.]|jgi:prolyl oligopeptidase|nr:prolyl oligopeptidase family serine peptidase [Rhizomicrobium sp.]
MTRFSLILAFVCFAFAGAQAVTNPAMTDPYAWLEDIHGAKPLAWVKDQNRKSLAVLKADPRYQKNYSSVLDVLDAPDRIPSGSLDHGFVYNFWQDAKNPKGIWRRTTIADYANPSPHWDVLLDVDALAKAEKENWVFEGAECAFKETRCLIRLSRGGGDAVVVREYDLKARHMAQDGFTLSEAKTDVSYLDDDTVLFGTDFGKGTLTKSGYARIVKLWKRGTQIASARTLYEGQVSDVAVSPATFHTSQGNFGLVIRVVSFFESEYYALDAAKGSVSKLDLPLSADVKGMIGGALIATLREDYAAQGAHFAKGALVAFHTGQKPQLIYAPGPRAAIESVGVGQDAIYAAITENVIGSIHVFTTDGKSWAQRKLDLPPGGAVDVVSVNDSGPEALFNFQSYLIPPTLYFTDGKAAPRAIKSLPARFDASGLVTGQFEATSKDGAKIPYFVTRPKNLTGPAPAVLYGYGGFEISLTPSYSANFGRLWLSHGGIYVVANIRGGGEFGPAWHEAATKFHRQRAYDDFAAVAQDLERKGFTTPRQLGIMGGSNGGLLVSTVMVERPELFGAVVCQVPLVDMIAYTHIGAGASWEGEYGDPADPKMRDYILTYSPYQNVKKDGHYPPVLFVTATSDDRVTPAHARKMAAKMEEQGHDVLFYENTDGGHAAAADHKQAAEMWALSFVYLAEKLGLKS